MPLTPKGKKIEGAMEKEYGEKKGKSVFYASKNKGTITGVEGKKKSMAKKMTKGERMIHNTQKKGKSIFPYESAESNNDRYQPE